MGTKKIASIKVVKAGSAPDVDSDFATYCRDDVLAKVTETYGKTNVANIITFSTLAAKGAFKAMCTIYQVQFAAANRIAALIPAPIEGVECTIEEIFDPSSDRYAEGEDFRTATSGEEWKLIIEGAKNIEGRIKTTGVHPCGVVMSSRPLADVIPLQVRQDDGRVISQWKYTELESLGLLKFDFLGLDTVDLIQHSVEYIQKNGKTPPNMVEIIHGPMDDTKTYEMIGRGETEGIFQLASDGVKDLLRRMKPTELNDIVATTALYRPGPMGMQSHIKYADRKNGREKVAYPIHPDFKGSPLEEILNLTWSLVVYQEQIIQIANRIAGMTLQEGDDLRKAMGKKDMAKMVKMRPKFSEGAQANGYSEEAIDALWDTIAEFAKYGFNKCAHGDTIVLDEHGRKMRLRDLHKRWELGERDFKLLSMWEDGTIRPHEVRNVVYTGKVPTYEVTTESGRTIKITKEHRLLTTSGYGFIEDGTLTVGMELMVDETERSFSMAPEERTRRSESMTKYDQSESGRAKAALTMSKTQALVTREQRIAWQQEIQANNPKRTDPWLEAGRERLTELRKDPIWVQKFAEALSKRDHAGLRGFGKVTQISDGRYCDSIVEAAAAEYLIARGVEFELHKVVENPPTGTFRISDFYAHGLYFEMDGLCRGEAWFRENKYGDVPFVYLTPYNFVDRIDEALAMAHASNGDKIVSISQPSTKSHKVYDVEMELEGPSNFIANEIVSHNSHSVAYAINGYQAAYLKANYPVEFIAALISQNIGRKEKILTFLKEAQRMKLKVGAVDINLSDIKVAPDYTKKSKFDILYGLGGINSVSETMAKIIVDERNANGLYTSVQDLVNRCSPLGVANKKIYENLALAGAFDAFEIPRKGVVDNLPTMLGESKVQQAKGDSLFDFMDTPVATGLDFHSGGEYSHLEKLKKEADVVGLYLTSHPLSNVGNLGGMRSTTIDKLLKSRDHSKVKIVGSLTEVVSKRTRRGGKSVAITIDDGTGYITAYVNREIVKGMDKRVSQAKLQDLYARGAMEIAPEISEPAISPEFEAREELEKGKVYIVEITYKPTFDDNPYAARVANINEVTLADDGSLPVRIRLPKPKTQDESKTQGRFLASLAKKYPGDSPLVYTRVDPSAPRDQADSIYLDALEALRDGEPVLVKSEGSQTVIHSGLTGDIQVEAKGKKIEREIYRPWPPPRVQNRSFGVAADSKKDIYDKFLGLSYRDSPFKVDKCAELAREIEAEFGIENYDFGVLNADIFFD